VPLVPVVAAGLAFVEQPLNKTTALLAAAAKRIAPDLRGIPFPPGSIVHDVGCVLLDALLLSAEGCSSSPEVIT
jgi:hypothetical protein